MAIFEVSLKWLIFSLCITRYGALKYIYKTFEDTDVTTTFSQINLIKSVKANSNLHCLSQCDRLMNCLSATFNSQLICNLYNNTITNQTNEINLVYHSKLSYKKFSTINESCVRTECDHRKLLVCDGTVCRCNSYDILNKWSAEQSRCIIARTYLNTCTWDYECDDSVGLVCISSVCNCKNSSFFWNGTKCDWNPITTYIIGDAKTSRGTWGVEHQCSNRGTVTGYQLKIEDLCYVVCDDTALNAILLLCDDSLTISSSQGLWGNWKNWQYCPVGTVLIGFSLRTQPDQGLGDDTAANDLQMKCSDGTILSNTGGTSLGSFGNWFTCSIGHICGIKTLVEPDQGLDDDTSLNNVQFTCCFP